MNEHEKRIKEQRTVEANKKNLMGFEGKIGCIVRNLGQPLISQDTGGTFFSSTPGYDFWELPNENDFGEPPSGTPEEILLQVPTLHIDGIEQPEGGEWIEGRLSSIYENIEKLGWYFDGLNRGMHLEIKYTNDTRELLVKYKGYIVYREISGDLESYVPSSEWEYMIDRLYITAKKNKIKENKVNKEEKTQKNKRDKENWLQKMKNKWGF